MGQLVPGVDVGVVGDDEDLLQALELLGAERRAEAPFLRGRLGRWNGERHTKQRPLAAGFSACYPTQRTEHAAIAWSDCAIQDYIITRCSVNV